MYISKYMYVPLWLVVGVWSSIWDSVGGHQQYWSVISWPLLLRGVRVFPLLRTLLREHNSVCDVWSPYLNT